MIDVLVEAVRSQFSEETKFLLQKPKCVSFTPGQAQISRKQHPSPAFHRADSNHGSSQICKKSSTTLLWRGQRDRRVSSFSSVAQTKNKLWTGHADAKPEQPYQMKTTIHTVSYKFLSPVPGRYPKGLPGR